MSAYYFKRDQRPAAEALIAAYQARGFTVELVIDFDKLIVMVS